MRNGQMGCDAGFQGMGCGVGCFVICWLAVALAVARGICIRWQRMAKGAEMRLQECLPCFCSIQPISQGTFPSLKVSLYGGERIAECVTAGRIWLPLQHHDACSVDDASTLGTV